MINWIICLRIYLLFTYHRTYHKPIPDWVFYKFLPQHFLNLRPLPQIHGSLRPTFGALRVIGVFGGQQLVSVHLGFSLIFIASYPSEWIIIIAPHPLWGTFNCYSANIYTLKWNLKKLIKVELNHELGSTWRSCRITRSDWRNRYVELLVAAN